MFQMKQTATGTKDDTVTKFAEALLRLANSFKNETENCGKMCGGLSEKEMLVIVFVGQNKNVKMSEIADYISTPMSTLTNTIDKLVDKGFLLRDHSGEDRRVINVSLSQAGKLTYNKLLDKRKKMVESILAGISEKEQAVIIKYLDLLSAGIGKG